MIKILFGGAGVAIVIFYFAVVPYILGGEHKNER